MARGARPGLKHNGSTGSTPYVTGPNGQGSPSGIETCVLCSESTVQGF